MSLLPPFLHRAPSRLAVQLVEARRVAGVLVAAAKAAHDALRSDDPDCPAGYAALLDATRALAALREAKERDPSTWRYLMEDYPLLARLRAGTNHYDEAVRLYRIVCPDPEPLPVLAGITRAEGWAATELLAALSAGTLALVLLLGHRPQQELQTERAGGGARG